MEKADFVVGSPFKNDAIRGSRTFPCCKCGIDTWLAPTGQEVLRRDSAQVICYPCLMKENPKECEILPPTKGQLDEVGEILGERVDENQITSAVSRFLGTHMGRR